jgi:hypothetical protein
MKPVIRHPSSIGQRSLMFPHSLISTVLRRFAGTRLRLMGFCYDKGIDPKAVLGENMDFDKPLPAQFNYRSGDIMLPGVKFTEPLRVFRYRQRPCVSSIHGQQPVSSRSIPSRRKRLNTWPQEDQY